MTDWRHGTDCEQHFSAFPVNANKNIFRKVHTHNIHKGIIQAF